MLVKTGEVKRVNWYLLSDGRLVSFHTAYTEHPFHNPDTEKIVFMSDNKTFAGVTAENLDIEYAYLRNSSQEEIDGYLADRNNLVLVEKVIEV